MNRIFCFLCGALLTNSTLLAQPSVTHSTPRAVTPGKTVELTLHGDKLTGPLEVWTSFPAKVELAGGDAKNLKCKITLDAAAPFGVGGVVVGNAAGGSDPLFLVVDDLNSVADNGKNHEIGQAQVLTAPIGVDGVGDGVVLDYYKVTLKAGQRISVEVLAGRISSTFDPVLRLLTSTGAEIAVADDDPALGADCRLSHVAQADGDVIVEVADSKFAGGGRYRLRVGDFPLVTTAYPLGGRVGSTAKFGFSGPAVEGVEPVLLTVGSGGSGGQVGVAARFPSGKSSALAQLATSSLPEVLETEPNNDKETATQVATSCAVNGVLTSEKDQDYYRFLATKGQRLTLRTKSRSLGSPMIAYVQLQKPDGGVVGQTNVGGEEEQTVSLVIPETGTYQLVVEDLLKRGGPGFGYRVEIENGNSFSLSIKNDKNTKDKFLTPIHDGAFALDVQCARQGYDGPVELTLEGDSDGFELFNATIPAKGAAVKVIVAVPPHFKPGDLRVLRLVGRATINGREVTRSLSTAAYVRTKRQQMIYPPAWTDGLLTVVTGNKAGPFFDVATDKQVIHFARALGTSQWAFTLQRKHKDFKAGITVAHGDLPAGFSLAVKQDKDKYNLTLTGPKDLPLGRQALKLLCYGEMGRGQTVVHTLPVEVIDPVAVSLTPAGAVAAGKTQKVKVTAVRKGTDPQPITVKFTKLPAGVTAAAEFTIPADKNEIEVELTAAGDAAAGKFDQLTVEAASKYSGQDIKAVSAPASIEVTKG
ncbi:MAG: PPC domain-containing protein [Planctomycetota bacterium]|nr:PPC domain-containing protein [Planctomycetota bacterium]